ncbi:PARP10_14_15 [Mytilus coruscus]|uniref:Poly [ADP-ribose] polymerase n=1 Tax=Mytilus coruscus TaxID=42192 RepID=A0A6J8CCN4_MYTCO|nr:PARP10_14_15 [Mytilus coruscus]
MKTECSKYIERHGICGQCLCITTAGNLTHYKKILHVKAPAQNENSTIATLTENISETIRICLTQANMDNINSIALPPFITLGFHTACNTDIVKTYPESVMKYSKAAGMKSSIKEIHFVHTDQADMEAIHAAFLQTIPDSYADEYIKQKDIANELLGYAEMNEFHTYKTSTKPLKFSASQNISDRTEKVKMYQSVRGLFSGGTQYQQSLMNATEDLSSGSIHKRKTLAYPFNPWSTAGTLHINEKKIETRQSSVRSSTLYRTGQDSLIMITKEGIKVFVYKADICYLSNIYCIVNPYSSRMNETDGSTNIVASAGEEMKIECSKYINIHGILRRQCVCITTAGSLTHYKKILHVKAPVRNENSTITALTENISETIWICLSQANMDNMTSIALPPLITLGFDTVWNTNIVKIYPESVMKYSSEAGMQSSIKEIHFVHTDQSEVEAIRSAFLQTIPDSNADQQHIKRKDRGSEFLGYAKTNEFHIFQTNTETSKFPVCDTTSDKTAKFKMCQSMPDLFSDSSENVPSNWTGMEAHEMITTVILQPHDQEYKDVVDEFKQTSAKHYDIIKVERIQNRTLHQQYKARKKLMDSIYPSCFNNERKLWHGTTLEAVDGINTYGFNRGYCGKNAASYGNGVYFAVNSSYSTKSQYSTPDHNNNKRVYLCKVLVGEYVKGQRDMRVPPQKYGASGSHILYDSVVDNPSAPRIFVIFHDAQAYPEYLVVLR